MDETQTAEATDTSVDAVADMLGEAPEPPRVRAPKAKGSVVPVVPEANPLKDRIKHLERVVSALQADNQKLELLWLERENRLGVKEGRKVSYRCMQSDDNGLTVCGAIVEANDNDTRARTGEKVICPKHGGRLTRMDPID